MMQFNYTFRQLLRHYISEQTQENLDRHEKVLSYHYQQYHRINGDVALNSEKINEASQIFTGQTREYRLIRDLWIARREFALTQGNLLQIPPTVKALRLYVHKYVRYRWLSLKCLPVLWWHQLKYIMRVGYSVSPKTFWTIITFYLAIAAVLFAMLLLILK